jgi:tRNA(Ile2) C34 agmatinyltransferase TiaS
MLPRCPKCRKALNPVPVAEGQEKLYRCRWCKGG